MDRNEVELAKGVVENYLAGADSRAAYWAVTLGIGLGIEGEPGDHKPGHIANRFVEVVDEYLAVGTTPGRP